MTLACDSGLPLTTTAPLYKLQCSIGPHHLQDRVFCIQAFLYEDITLYTLIFDQSFPVKKEKIYHKTNLVLVLVLPKWITTHNLILIFLLYQTLCMVMALALLGGGGHQVQWFHGLSSRSSYHRQLHSLFPQCSRVIYLTF